jgi:hypothetical protein
MSAERYSALWIYLLTERGAVRHDYLFTRSWSVVFIFVRQLLVVGARLAAEA